MFFFGRMETQLETHQREEQHGFWGGRRVDEHVVTTHFLSYKFFSANVPIWIVTLDLSATVFSAFSSNPTCSTCTVNVGE